MDMPQKTKDVYCLRQCNDYLFIYAT